ncbi:leucine-rich repeat-containing protein 26 [Anser cygnoides]|uniref:Leucine rich repeat containing 26 n=1 Tax=Anser cygnoides TaxID=8845 RepID=A0A8B9DWF4_ANSCY|nr:leucine-rich repeat-containing protein 26 [Anser cygnoides]
MHRATGSRARPPAHRTQGCRARTSDWARRGALGTLPPGGALMLGAGEPPLREWAAMGVWRGPSTVLALLLLLCPLPAPACPTACRCWAGDVDCRQRALHEVPPRLPTNASTLWLGYNFIAVLRARAFPSLPALLRLSLPHNHLGMIDRQALVGLGALQELDLSNNYLAMLSPESFLPLGSLVTLNLGNNRLEELGAGVLSALPQLHELFLHGNPWVCSCSILPLWRWLGHNRDKVPEESSLQCVFPEQLNTYPIMAFRNESFWPCQKTPLSAQHYATFLLLGLSSFLASIIFCTLMGCVVVIYQHLRKEPRFCRRPLLCRGH